MTARWMHFTDEDSVEPRSVTQVDHSRSKPNGFWISDESAETSWTSWATGEDYSIGANAFRVDLAPDARLLWLTSVSDIDTFHGAYCTDPHGWTVDWTTVAESWQGIIITPYQWERRLSSVVSWYYTWDCASGCIWDASAIASVAPLLVSEHAS